MIDINEHTIYIIIFLYYIMGKLSAGGNNRGARTKKSAGTGKSVGRKNVASMNRVGQKCCSNPCELCNINSTKTLTWIFEGAFLNGIKVEPAGVVEGETIYFKFKIVSDFFGAGVAEIAAEFKEDGIDVGNCGIWATTDVKNGPILVKVEGYWELFSQSIRGPITLNNKKVTCLRPGNKYQYQIVDAGKVGVLNFSVRYD